MSDTQNSKIPNQENSNRRNNSEVSSRHQTSTVFSKFFQCMVHSNRPFSSVWQWQFKTTAIQSGGQTKKNFHTFCMERFVVFRQKYISLIIKSS